MVDESEFQSKRIELINKLTMLTSRLPDFVYDKYNSLDHVNINIQGSKENKCIRCIIASPDVCAHMAIDDSFMQLVYSNSINNILLCPACKWNDITVYRNLFGSFGELLVIYDIGSNQHITCDVIDGNISEYLFLFDDITEYQFHKFNYNYLEDII